jgi:hypothetical protein
MKTITLLMCAAGLRHWWARSTTPRTTTISQRPLQPVWR